MSSSFFIQAASISSFLTSNFLAPLLLIQSTLQHGMNEYHQVLPVSQSIFVWVNVMASIGQIGSDLIDHYYFIIIFI
jgi:hypothetical protein